MAALFTALSTPVHPSLTCSPGFPPSVGCGRTLAVCGRRFRRWVRWQNTVLPIHPKPFSQFVNVARLVRGGGADASPRSVRLPSSPEPSRTAWGLKMLGECERSKAGIDRSNGKVSVLHPTLLNVLRTGFSAKIRPLVWPSLKADLQHVTPFRQQPPSLGNSGVTGSEYRH